MPRTVDFAAILQRLSDNDPTLTTLDLSGQDLTFNEISALTQALINNTSLQILNLSNNRKIMDDHVEAIAQVLENNTSLKSLNLREINICTDQGAWAIAQALEKNTSLESLDLSNNNISNGGNQAISQALEKNTSLLSLNLRYDVNHETLERINKNLERNLQLKKYKENQLAKNLLCLLHEKSIVQSSSSRSRLSILPIDLLHFIFQSTGIFYPEQKGDFLRNILFARIAALLAYRQTLSSQECKTAEWIQWKNEKQKGQFKFKFPTITGPSLSPVSEESKERKEETSAICLVRQ